MQSKRIGDLAQEVIEKAGAKGLMVATAESCTGGMIGAALTDISGSSAVFERGFITYSNEAKTELIGVPADLIGRRGAVSEEVAGAMAQGALERSNAAIAVSVTGIAGPDGGTPEKPVGLVWFALARRGHPLRTEKRLFKSASRDGVRKSAVETALTLILEAVAAS